VLRAREREIARVEELFLFPDSERVRRGFELTLEEIRALAEEVRADGARFTLLVFPFRFQVEEGTASPGPQQRLERFSRESGIPYLDLLPALRGAGREAFLDYDHLSPKGAERVARALVKSGLLVPRRPDLQ